MAKPPQLPHDLVFYGILPKLPGKSVGRFRCVSRAWYSFLKKPEFTKIHLNDHVSKNQSQKLLIISFYHTNKLKLNTFDSEAKPDSRNHIVSSHVSGDVTSVSALGSCNGLVCMALWHRVAENQTSIDIVVCNPLTGEYKKLDSMSSFITRRGHEEFFGFYYDENVDDYKILNVSAKGKAFLYSLKTKSWREVEGTVDGAYFRHDLRRRWVFVNRSVCWIAGDMHNQNRKLVISFDLNMESLKVVQIPDRFFWLCDHQEQLHAFSVNRNEIELWSLWRMNNDDNKKEESWEKTGTKIHATITWLCHFGFTNRGKLLYMRHSDGRYELAAYNLENQNIECCEIQTPIGDTIAYTETLVSPNDIVS